jgi:hypothetical protein
MATKTKSDIIFCLLVDFGDGTSFLKPSPLFRIIAKIEEWPAFKRISNMANNFDVTPKTNSIRVPTQKYHSNDWRPKNNLRINRGQREYKYLVTPSEKDIL